MKFIIDEMPKLNLRISKRLNQVEKVFKSLDASYGFKADKIQEDSSKGIINTYWQLVIKAPTNKTRSRLLPLGIETSFSSNKKQKEDPEDLVLRGSDERIFSNWRTRIYWVPIS